MVNQKIKYLLFANYLNFFAFAFFTPLFALFVTGLNPNPAVVGIAWGVNMYAAGAMILLFGRYENRIKNQEKLVVTGFFIMAVAFAGYILVDNLTELFLVQLINAVGLGMATPAWRTLYSKDEDKGRETVEWSFVDGGNRFFVATGAIAGGLILKYGSFQLLFAVMATIQLIAALVSMNLLSGQDEGELPERE
jgi:predicted MFS family arabinose efflux permease